MSATIELVPRNIKRKLKSCPYSVIRSDALRNILASIQINDPRTAMSDSNTG